MDRHYSQLEVILITGIVIMCVFFAGLYVRWHVNQQAKGDDALMENTADSVARINSNNGLNCPVDGSSGPCPHWTSEGWVAYYDNGINTIVGDKPRGYNEYTTMEINGIKYHGARNTMVIKVVCREGYMQLSWEKGKE